MAGEYKKKGEQATRDAFPAQRRWVEKPSLHFQIKSEGMSQAPNKEARSTSFHSCSGLDITKVPNYSLFRILPARHTIASLINTLFTKRPVAHAAFRHSRFPVEILSTRRTVEFFLCHDSIPQSWMSIVAGIQRIQTVQFL
jgi:hypothetical protein